MDSHEGEEGLQEDSSRTPWRFHVSWYALVLLGLLLYELTSQPGLAAAVTCAKFGWVDWRTAFWLRRVDPDWRRARTCFWFYLSFGLWKVALMATLVMLVLLMVASPGWRGGMSPALVGVLVAAGVGFGLSFLLTHLGLALALRHRIKVWLGPAPHLARRRKYWPPEAGRQNAAPFVIVTTLILTLWIALVGLALVGAELGRAQGGMVIGIVLMAVLALASPGTLFVLKYLDDRVFARSPEECWPADELGPLCQADDLEAALCDE